MKLKKAWEVLKSSVVEFINDDALTLAAAVALYTALSLAPLLLVAVWIVGMFYTGNTQEKAVEEAAETVGSQGAEVIRTVLDNASDPGQSIPAAIIGIGTFLFFASGVFAQLQYSLNRIWNVKARPDAPWWDWLRKRFWTLVMMAVIAMVFLASIVASAALSMLQRWWGDAISMPLLWRTLNIVVPFLIYILLFAMVYKLLPDVQMPWSDAWIGALITAVLFAAGKLLLSWYIGRGTTGSVYGAAGSLVALLTWLYYSALIFFFGAELTQAIARQRGERIRPSRHAQWIDPKLAAEKTGQSEADTRADARG